MPTRQHLHQEFEDLYVPASLGNVCPPGVESVRSEQKAMRVGFPMDQRFDIPRQDLVVLRVFQDGEVFPMSVAPDTGQALQHLIAGNYEVIFFSVLQGQNCRPDGVSVQDCSRPRSLNNRQMNRRLSRRPALALDHCASAIDEEEIFVAQRSLLNTALCNPQPEKDRRSRAR